MNTGTSTYRQADFDAAKQVCDLVMKGGITSGVVYPLTAVELARTYRFSSIGGTSAGAIAAAVTAAAEYNRANGGFLQMAKLPDEIGRDLLRLFQPVPALRPLFRLFLAFLEPGSIWRKILACVGIAASSYPGKCLLGMLLGIVIGILMLSFHAFTWQAAFLTLLVLLLGFAAGMLAGLYKSVHKDLPGHEYGLCSGATQPGYNVAGLTHWLADTIDATAGKKIDGSDTPLTFGDLADRKNGKAPIKLSMMTTNLMLRRPHVLPMQDRTYLFRKSDFERLLPRRIYDFVIAKSEPFDTGNPADDYYHLPAAADMPVVLAARMSLSFPLLISAIPLYARDFTLLEEGERAKPRLCLFSDGGLSSNFPIHFFDHLWPNTPTFGISLDAFDPKRNEGRSRTWMPSTAGGGVLLPILGMDGSVIAFLARLVDAAKDWQDNLQSTLSGYRERIVHITLKDDEGGLNLTMDQARIDKLTAYGAEAGRLPHAEFNLDEHRWHRFLVAMASIEKTLDKLVTSYETHEPGIESFEQFLERYPPIAKSYRQDPPHLRELMLRAEELVALGRRWKHAPTIRSGNIPRPEAELRITPALDPAVPPPRA